MSDWVHVAGIIRIDCIMFEQLTVEEATEIFEGIFGKELRFHSDDELWREADEHPERFLPCGSEGSLTMSVWVNPDIGSITSFVVSIFGDLRDRNDPDTIIEWFKEKCKTGGISVRNACVTARCNSGYGHDWSC